jgi:hypothetical protein
MDSPTKTSLRPLLFSEEWGKEVQKQMVEVIEKLEEFAFNGEVDEEGAELEEPETPTGISYCGCQDCFVREVTYLAMQLALDGHAQGLIEFDTES